MPRSAHTVHPFEEDVAHTMAAIDDAAHKPPKPSAAEFKFTVEATKEGAEVTLETLKTGEKVEVTFVA